jgi:lipopolysaccharide transport system ATP-binding protein
MPEVIRIENISKRYRLGVLDGATLKQDIGMAWKKATGGNQAGTEELQADNFLWALRNINLGIEQGQPVGFIGKNGAGKSTLLKILSRVTLPTSGSIKGIGRIASLLEVGTGFHPELTGRENVFLNGHILGMTRKEIQQKFDDIISFSGVEPFIDTPVKRYSSGMYVRLSFAVAAHLNPDILIVDEALAVGDAEFQARCHDKMKEIANRQGKTVIFVSHNLQAIRNLCQRAVYFENGTIADDGKPDEVIAGYLKKEHVQFLSVSFDTPENARGNQLIRIKKAAIVANQPNNEIIDTATPLSIEFEFWQFLQPGSNVIAGVHLYDFSGVCLLDMYSDAVYTAGALISGHCNIPPGFLASGSYYISIDFIKDKNERLYFYEACLSFDVKRSENETMPYSNWNGFIRPGFPVTLTQTDRLA